MTNEHIEVVKRWIAGEEVSVEVLKANADAAWVPVACGVEANAAAYVAADAAAKAADADAVYWVKRYEELTNE